MARPTLATHPKFAKLVRRLRSMPAPRIYARGVLEIIWEAGYASGDPLVGDAEIVEFMADWPGEPGVLAGHLVEAGFLDVDDHGIHYIHDLADHAPGYVAKRMAKEHERRVKGQSISSLRAKAARVRWAKRMQMDAEDMQEDSSCMQTDDVCMQEDANGRHLHGKECKRDANALPPAPAPNSFSPARVRDPSATDTAARATGSVAGPPSTLSWPSMYPVGAKTETFKRVFAPYPRKDAENRAAGAFAWLAEQTPGGEKVLAEAILGAYARGILKRHPYVGPNDKRPYFETFLKDRRWEDQESAPDDGPREAARCAWHQRPGTSQKRARTPDSTCPDCRHLDAASGARASEPAPPPLPSYKPPAEWTPEQRAEFEALKKGKTP